MRTYGEFTCGRLTDERRASHDVATKRGGLDRIGLEASQDITLEGTP